LNLWVLGVVLPKKINRDERILSYAIGPMIRGRRASSVLRLRLLPGNLLQIENLTKGMWRAIAQRFRTGRVAYCGLGSSILRLISFGRA
jgi:hypothetical protein